MAVADSIIQHNLSTYLADTVKPDSAFHFQEITTNTILNEIAHSSFIADWKVIVIITLLILIVSVSAFSGNYLYYLIQSTFNRQTASRLFREKVMNILHPAYRLEIIFYISMGLFLSEVSEKFLHYNLSNLNSFFIGIFITIIFVNTKYIFYSISGFLFNVQSEINEYIYYSRSGNHIMGLFLLPPAVLFIFFEGLWQQILLILGTLTVLLFSVISLFKGVKIITQKDFSIYYLILYLCTLEILPLLLVWRILWRM